MKVVIITSWLGEMLALEIQALNYSKVYKPTKLHLILTLKREVGKEECVTVRAYRVKMCIKDNYAVYKY